MGIVNHSWRRAAATAPTASSTEQQVLQGRIVSEYPFIKAPLSCLSREEVHDAPGGGIVVRPWGERSFYAEDPWGNPLCFVEEGTVYTG